MRISFIKHFSLCVLLALSQGSLAQDTPTEKSNRYLEAIQSNDIKNVTQMLREGFNVDTRDSRGRTALLIATYLDLPDLAKLLIESGADVNARDTLNDTPYLYAGAEGRLEILRMTVQAGADLDSVNRYGGTALIPAAHHGKVETVEYLLTIDIDIDHINFLGWTALLEAVILGDGSETYQSIVRMLLDAGANQTIADKSGETPLDHARKNGYPEIITLLENSKSGE